MSNIVFPFPMGTLVRNKVTLASWNFIDPYRYDAKDINARRRKQKAGLPVTISHVHQPGHMMVLLSIETYPDNGRAGGPALQVLWQNMSHNGEVRYLELGTEMFPHRHFFDTGPYENWFEKVK